jgi:mycofactocin precursor
MSPSTQRSHSEVESLEPSAPAAEQNSAQVDDADLLVEDVSIDGMCGVY